MICLIRLWNSRVPVSCTEQFPDEPWRCYFGYRLYPTLNTPLFVVQYQYDEFQIYMDGMTSRALNEQERMQYIQALSDQIRQTLSNVSAVFSPSCMSHIMLTKLDWHKVSINGVTLPEALNCWEQTPLVHSTAGSGHTSSYKQAHYYPNYYHSYAQYNPYTSLYQKSSLPVVGSSPQTSFYVKNNDNLYRNNYGTNLDQSKKNVYQYPVSLNYANNGANNGADYQYRQHHQLTKDVNRNTNDDNELSQFYSSNFLQYYGKSSNGGRMQLDNSKSTTKPLYSNLQRAETIIEQPPEVKIVKLSTVEPTQSAEMEIPKEGVVLLDTPNRQLDDQLGDSGPANSTNMISFVNSSKNRRGERIGGNITSASHVTATAATGSRQSNRRRKKRKRRKNQHHHHHHHHHRRVQGGKVTPTVGSVIYQIRNELKEEQFDSFPSVAGRQSSTMTPTVESYGSSGLIYQNDGFHQPNGPFGPSWNGQHLYLQSEQQLPKCQYRLIDDHRIMQRNVDCPRFYKSYME